MAKSKRSAKKTENKVDNEILTYIYALLLITLSIIGILNVGIVGTLMSNIVKYFFGNLYGVVYLGVCVVGVMMLLKKSFKSINFRSVFGCVCLFCSWLLLISSPSDKSVLGMSVLGEFFKNSIKIFNQEIPSTVGHGGLIGAVLYSFSTLLFDTVGTWIFIVALWILGFLMFANNRYVKVFFKACATMVKSSIASVVGKEKKTARRKNKKPKRIEAEPDFEMDVLNSDGNHDRFDFLDINDDSEVQATSDAIVSIAELEHETIEDQVADELLEQEVEILPAASEIKHGEADPKEVFVSSFEVDYSNYKLPKLSLLGDSGKNARSMTNNKVAKEKGNQLMKILDQFGVKATLVDIHVGPSVTKFEVKPDLGVRVNKISNLQDDIKLELATKDIRIEAPIPGKPAVGIEIPNVEKTMVSLKEVIRNVPEKYADSKLMFALGKDLLGENVYGELNKLTHLLIAGTTGSGKSVCVNSIITSLLLRSKPDEVKLLLIDPKKVEFMMYSEIPHLIGPVITDAEEANAALKVIVTKMEDRYADFAQLGVRNIAGYNQHIEANPELGLTKMPWIVVIIDELADLMMVASKEIEASIQRITQKARAAGIHLIVATQRPSVDVITGVIKANIPSRIAFAVSSAIDSRTILDQQGAEKLLGYGDMLYFPIGESALQRVQGVFVSDDEVKRICDFCSAQARPKFDDAFIRLQLLDGGVTNYESFDDPLYEEVKEFVIQSQKASTSFIQRKFSIGYSRAARLVDVLEERGVVGPARGSKPREVYMKKKEDEIQ